MSDKKDSILIVDDDATNLSVLNEILKDDYMVLLAKNGEKALEIAKENHPELILLDVMMPEMDGFEVCRRLKADHATHNIPVVFVTAMSEISDETHGFEVGAADYIAKPIKPVIVKARVETQIAFSRLRNNLTEAVRVQVQKNEKLVRDSIQMLGVAGHFNDTDTGVHIWRMASYARALAVAAGWSEEDAEQIEMAAPLHDMGKIAIPDSILKKPGKLDAEEWEIMKTHSKVGAEILMASEMPMFVLATEIAMSHHEKWDGNGYPEGLKGEDIPESARIVAIADVFDALTMRRPYKEAWPVEKAAATIQEDSGTHFDPKLAELFQQILPKILELKEEWDGWEDEDEWS